ncbi:MAG: hypothetical protein R3F59_30045 [Myxococcota bacterium]
MDQAIPLHGGALDLQTGDVLRAGERIRLTAKERALLAYLA